MSLFDVVAPKLEQLVAGIELDGMRWGPSQAEYANWISDLKAALSVVQDSDRWIERVEEAERYSTVTHVHRFGQPSNPGLSRSDYAARIQKFTAVAKEALENLNLRNQIAQGNPQPSAFARPKIFIAHGGKSQSRDQLVRFIDALGCDSIIVENMARSGASPGSNVHRRINSCDFAIVLATSDRGAIQDDELLPRVNVIEEMGRISEVFGEKRILLLESGLAVPTNASDWTWTRFTEESMDEAFIAVATELTDIGLLTAGALDDQVDE